MGFFHNLMVCGIGKLVRFCALMIIKLKTNYLLLVLFALYRMAGLTIPA